MAHLWLHEATDDEAKKSALEEWSPRLLDGDSLAVPSAQLLRCTTDGGDAWVLVGPPAVRVNGSRLDTGIRVLCDRDELRADGGRTFFSSESLAMVVPFPGGAKTIFCPRCKLEIVPGSPAVRCPQCGVFHHQSDEFPCWTYAARCAMCDQPTALDAGFRWVPEELGRKRRVRSSSSVRAGTSGPTPSLTWLACRASVA